MNLTPNELHRLHSQLVAGFSASRESFVDYLEAKAGAVHRLKSGIQGFHVVSVTFTEYEDRPDRMAVHCSNWRAEDEPNGVYTKEACRTFWRQLTQAGFVPF